MSNMTSTSYVFRSREKAPIEEFRNNLLNWTKSKSLLESAWDGSPYWLGNILLHAGFEYNEKEHQFEGCRCRGTLEEIGDLEEIESREETFFCFYVSTETAYRIMPKMWELIINKLYPGKMEFGFFAVDECNEYIEMYNPEILEFIGIDSNVEFWFDCFIDTRKHPRFNGIEECYGEMSAERAAGTLSVILGRQVTEEEIKNSEHLEILADEANELLENVDKDYYVNIREISLVSPSDFE